MHILTNYSVRELGQAYHYDSLGENSLVSRRVISERSRGGEGEGKIVSGYKALYVVMLYAAKSGGQKVEQ